MGVNVGRCGNIAVTEPHLDIFQRHTLAVQKRRARVPQIVKANSPKPVLFQEDRKMRRQIFGLNELPELVDIYVFLILFGIGISAERFERLLRLFHPQQQVLDGRYQR